MFEVCDLRKQFSGIQVLHGVSFRIERGEILGYLGPNGSGKSTTVKIIAGLLEPSSGRITFDGTDIGNDPPAFRRRLGYVPEEPNLYTHLTAVEYLRLVGLMRDLPAARLDAHITTLLRLLDLELASYGPLSSFSKGMRQRVLLAGALLHDPDLLILDEPFSGLDVNASRMLRAMLQALQRRGKMILFSSHQMDVVETLCRRVLILHRGRVVAEGPPQELRRARVSGSLEEVFSAVTEQEDYTARAEAIVNAGQRGQ
jgi:ABC-2 type transport system ATP-binding protein